MPLTIAPALQGFVQNRTHRYAKAWKIRRQDAFTLYLTDHNTRLTLPDDNVYTPMGSFKASARRKEIGLENNDLEITGALTSPAITHEDLRLGRYREAEVTEQLVDWRYPWAGVIRTTRYWIVETEFDREQWTAQISGVHSWLRYKFGEVFGRTCEHDLGDADCTVNLVPFTVTGVAVNSILTARRKFIGDGSINGFATGYFDDGFLLWRSGLNNGLECEIRRFDTTNDSVELHLSTPYAIVAGDLFDITAGCDKLAGTCSGKFANLVHFGGWPFIPGTDKLLSGN